LGKGAEIDIALEASTFMALTGFQRDLCQVLAEARFEGSAAYVAGGSALNEIIGGGRLSGDIYLFHDFLEALEATWLLDKALLVAHGYDLFVKRERKGIVEAVAAKNGETTEIQWVRDRAFRFFPLQSPPDSGLTLHPFDMATNKILALVGRVEARDWVDTMTCVRGVAPLALLAWAAVGKDEGWNPWLVVEEANRNAKYSREELQNLEWEATAPIFSALKGLWRQEVASAREIIATLQPDQVGQAVLNRDGTVFRDDAGELRLKINSGDLLFHPGRIRGVWPTVS